MAKAKRRKPGSGRVLRYKSADALQKAIDAYFDECKNKTKPFVTKDGKILQVPDPRIPTIAGLARALKVDRQTIYNYEDLQIFFDVIKNARTYILSMYEDRAANETGNLGGLIFLMKNYGYTDNNNISLGLNDLQLSALVGEANRIMQQNV